MVQWFRGKAQKIEKKTIAVINNSGLIWAIQKQHRLAQGKAQQGVVSLPALHCGIIDFNYL